ncbi:sugar transferase [Gordonia rhizosphera]|uniref:Putative glycosyltransferase n=1 Tax=Gordonia rhizosphera NBRC 16068 TaxID=1108045 RepID=K6V801_9ACTN|nr:sugar transferase [Gordonia rhizosphera]GAB92323.1 putative glycosyltransferase [Gordonia rhizosphera NBRC 16068]
MAAWTDAAMVISAVFLAQWIRFGSSGEPDHFGGVGGPPVLVVSLLLIAAWLVALRVYQTLDHRIIGAGPQEYSRVVTACFSVFGLLAILVLAFRLEVSRGYFALALPLGTLGLLASRWSWRRHLVRQRHRGKNLERVLVVGEPGSVAHMVDRLRGSPALGFDVIGACLPKRSAATEARLRSGDGEKIPVYGDFDDVALAVSASRATTVAVTSAGALGHAAMQELSWDLQGMDVQMMVAPGVTDVAGPRIMVRPVAGLPLLYIDKPRYEGANRFRKAFVDRVGAAAILVLIAPVLLAVAVAIKIDSPGPVFYRATRMGLGNSAFRMWKFRSMVADAEARKGDLSHQNEGAGVLFKIREDPRITRVGHFIRRYSIDELPQLFNVLTGTMSLVGPRPPLPEEVKRYDGRVARRMLVKPGMTGLWQVSGRSDLSWEESVRLDLSYVENWSIMQDLVILWRTIKAVMSGDGAY